MNRKIAVLMGSDSDFAVMRDIIPVLRDNGVDYDFRVISAHRTPEIAADFARDARKNGYDLIIAGAGMSAHLAGVLASCTGVPVIGVPVLSSASGMDGMDALHSVIQMPPGIPVATVGIDQAAGAARLAVKMLDGGRGAEPLVKLVLGGGVTDADADKTATALAVYGIRHEAVSAGEDTAHGAFAIVNLSDGDLPASLADGGLPVITVPRKAAGNGFNDTSNKIYKQTSDADGAAFVGVGSYQNAAHLAARVWGIHNPAAYDAVVAEHAKLAAAVIEKDAKLYAEVNEGKKQAQA